jgi:hypothetical protein
LHYFFEDFDTFLEEAMYISTTESGNTIDLMDGDGGLMQMAITAVTKDYATLTTLKEIFTIEAGKKLWIGLRTRMDIVPTAGALWGFGLGTMGTDYVGTTPAEGLFFRQDGDAAVDISVNTGGAVSASALAIHTQLANTWNTYEVEFDGKTAFKYFVDGKHVGTLSTASFPTTELALFLYSQAATATANSSAFDMAIDWMYAAKERTNVND